MVEVLGYSLLASGAVVCCLNFYLSFLQYPLCKLLGREYKRVSGIPIVGSLLVIIGVAILRESRSLYWGGIVIALLDTGGLHWFAGVMLWMYVFHRGST